MVGSTQLKQCARIFFLQPETLLLGRHIPENIFNHCLFIYSRLKSWNVTTVKG